MYVGIYENIFKVDDIKFESRMSVFFSFHSLIFLLLLSSLYLLFLSHNC